MLDSTSAGRCIKEFPVNKLAHTCQSTSCHGPAVTRMAKIETSLDSLTIGTEFGLKLKYLHEIDLDTTMSPTVPRPDFQVSK